MEMRRRAQVKQRRRSLTKIFESKKHCIICGEHCNVVKDKKHPDRWEKNKGLRCTTAGRGKGNLSFKGTLLQVNKNTDA